MGKFYDHIPNSLIQWIYNQKIFYVATAPLAEDGHVNVSPKGFENTMHIVTDEPSSAKATSNAVWYEDLTGSGIETISHVNENGRITIMFVAFEGPPMIVRLFGTGKVFEFGTPEYDELLPADKRQPGSRAVVWIDVHKVGSSCGYSIPFFTYKAPRYRLHRSMQNKEQNDADHYASCLACDPEEPTPQSSMVIVSTPTSPGLPTVRDPEPPANGIKNYWKLQNTSSIDGVPGLVVAPDSAAHLTDWRAKGVSFPEDDESIPNPATETAVEKRWEDVWSVGEMGKLLVGFGLGVLVTTTFARLNK